MKFHSIVTALFLVLALASCNLPGAEPTATPFPPTQTLPAFTPTVTFTPTPTEIPTAAPTATSSVPMVTPSDEPVNCRFGPGTQYAIIGALVEGASAQIYGKTADGGWWQIANPSTTGEKCWAAASVTTASGNLSQVAVVAAPATFVTAVTLTVEPKLIDGTACVSPFLPVTLKGTIEVNGPAIVKWHFETQQGGAMPEQTTEFDAFGAKEVSVTYVPLLPAGSYWARLIVTSPNNITAEAEYEIDCP